MISKNQSWKELVSIQAGGIICLPSILIGFIMGQHHSLLSSFVSIILGNFILMLMAIFISYFASLNEKSTAEWIAEIFGGWGTRFFAFILILAMVGWFAVQLEMVGKDLVEMFAQSFDLIIQPFHYQLINLFLGAVMTIVGLYGLRGITLFSSATLPLLLFTLGYVMFQVDDGVVIRHESEVLLFSGITLIVGAAIAGVVDLPTFFRHARSPKDAVVAAMITFGVVLPIIEGIGVYLASFSESHNLIALFAHVHSHFIWLIWIAFFFLLAGWTTNNANLFSGGVNLELLLPKSSNIFRMGVIGGLGSLLSMIPVNEWLEPFLETLGLLLGSMGVIMTLYFVLNKKGVARETDYA